MRRITVDAPDNIARAAAVLSTGGGADPYIGKLMAQGTLRRRAAYVAAAGDGVRVHQRRSVLAGIRLVNTGRHHG